VVGLSSRLRIAWAGRIDLIEDEYLRTMRQAELAWNTEAWRTNYGARTLRWTLEDVFQAIRAAKLVAEVNTSTP
jgi:hypothetical protein